MTSDWQPWTGGECPVAGDRILVCGGRDFNDRALVFGTLNAITADLRRSRLTIIQGGADGADKLAREWAMAQPSFLLINEPADWRKHGRSAGPIRNQLMLDKHKPDIVLAFPGGRGTADMVRRAKAAGVSVVEFADRRIVSPSRKEMGQ